MTCLPCLQLLPSPAGIAPVVEPLGHTEKIRFARLRLWYRISHLAGTVRPLTRAYISGTPLPGRAPTGNVD